jgi:ATP-dependent DNA helicase RecQ
VDHERFGALTLTDLARPILRGEAGFTLRQPSAKKRLKAGRGQSFASGAEAGLFERLRAWRAELAKAREVPAYVIFHDATLREIAARAPTSLADLAGISGVGDRKLEAYGEALLAVLAAGSGSGDPA